MLGKLTHREIEALLLQQHVGRIGCTDGNKPYVVPVNYVYHNGHILCHSGNGHKIQMMRRNPNICFEVDEISDLVHWKSVIAQGRYHEIIGLKEKTQVMQKINDAIMPFIKNDDGHPSHGITELCSDVGDSVELVLYKLVLTEKSGRFEIH